MTKLAKILKSARLVMIIALLTLFLCPFSVLDNGFLIIKDLVGTFSKVKALVGFFSRHNKIFANVR